jgi:hypothetical protein
MVADKVFGFFTTKPISPVSSPQRQTSSVHRISENETAKDLARSNTKTRTTSVLGGVPGATVLAKKREKSTSYSIPRSTTDVFSSPKSRTQNTMSKSVTQTFPSEILSTRQRSRTEGAGGGPELLPPVRRPVESPKVNKAAKKLGELAPDKASTGAARRVMEFFRRRTRGLGD